MSGHKVFFDKRDGTPPVDTSTAGEWKFGTKGFTTPDGFSWKIVPVGTIQREFPPEYLANLATLREQLEREIAKGMGLLKTIAFCNDQIVKRDAALKQKDEQFETIIRANDSVNTVIYAEVGLAIQPDSTALKTVRDAETAKLREMGEALVTAIEAYTATREYQNVEACRKDQDRLEQEMLVAKKRFDQALSASAQKAGQQ